MTKRSRAVEIERIAEPVARTLGYEIVRVRMMGGQRPVLQIMAERDDGSMNVDDCAALSHAISEALEAEDPVEGAFVLEVSSPGIDRPLTRRRDFEAYAGHEVRLDLTAPIDGRKRVRGLLKGLRGEHVVVAVTARETEVPVEVSLPFDHIADAKLVLTDALIEQDLKRRKTAGKRSSQTQEGE